MGCGASTGAETLEVPCANGSLRKGSRCQTQWERAEGGNDKWYCASAEAVPPEPATNRSPRATPNDAPAPDQWYRGLSYHNHSSAGAFATALLIFSTQLRLLLTFGFWPQLGDSPASDAEILRQFSDLARDGLTEALVLMSWRLTRTELSRLD